MSYMQAGWPFASAVWFTPFGHRTRINGWLQCVVRPSLNEASAPWISAMQGVRRAAIVRPMTLEQLSALAQIVGAGALLGSLIFVGLQIRQNTHSQRVVAVESLAAAIAAINVPAMQSPALGTALATALKDWSLASHDERVLAH